MKGAGQQQQQEQQERQQQQEQQQQQQQLLVTVQRPGKQDKVRRFRAFAAVPCRDVRNNLQQEFGPGNLCDDNELILLPGDQLQPGNYVYTVFPAAADERRSRSLELELEQPSGAAAAAPEVASTAEAITRLETQLTVLVHTTAAAAHQQQQVMPQLSQMVQVLVIDRLRPRTSSTSTQLRNSNCRAQAISYYYPQQGPQLDAPPKLRCMLLEEELVATEVVAAHIYQRHWGPAIAHHLGLGMNDPRNLLLLVNAAEKRFDELRWTLKPLAPSFGTGPEGQLRSEQTFKVLVLDPALLKPSNNTHFIAQHVSRTTWSSAHGKLLVFAEGQVPYRRACALHASRALQYAAEQGWAGHLSEEDKLVEEAAYAASPTFDQCLRLVAHCPPPLAAAQEMVE